jgi:hypothetical protein
MPYPSMPYGQATHETDLGPFQGWTARKASGMWPSSIPLDTPRRTPMVVRLDAIFVLASRASLLVTWNGHNGFHLLQGVFDR